MDPMNEYKVRWTRRRLLRAFDFLKLLRVEPYLFLITFQASIKATPNSMLLQDKICKLWYNQTDAYCYDLPTSKESSHGLHDFKSKILADSAQFGTYHTYISTGPALIWALFVGGWIDRYVKGRKILIIMSASASIIDTLISTYLAINFKTSIYYNLLPYIPAALAGGHMASRIAITHYMTATTPPKLRAIRFMIYELCIFVASPIGSSLGGYLLTLKPMFHFGEIRNYSSCFLIALAFEVFAFSWVVFMIDEKTARDQAKVVEKLVSGSTQETNEENNYRNKKEDSKKHPIKLLFDISNVKDMLKCCLRSRPNRVRVQLYLLFSTMFVYLMTHNGPAHINTQFVQKQYFWGPDYQSYMNSLSNIVHTIATLTIVPVLIKGINVKDVQLTIIGLSCFFINEVIKGTITTSLGYYLTLPLGSITGITSIGIRSYMSKIISRDEIGKVFSFMSAVDTLAPMIATTLFTYLYRQTMDTYPGAVYHLVCVFLIYPLMAMIWIDLFTKPPIDERKRSVDRIEKIKMSDQSSVKIDVRNESDTKL